MPCILLLYSGGMLAQWYAEVRPLASWGAACCILAQLLSDFQQASMQVGCCRQIFWGRHKKICLLWSVGQTASIKSCDVMLWCWSASSAGSQDSYSTRTMHIPSMWTCALHFIVFTVKLHLIENLTGKTGHFLISWTSVVNQWGVKAMDEIIFG